MTRIGLFLEAEPNAGGIFQYSQAMLEALTTLAQSGYDVQIACTSEAWRAELAHVPLPVTWLRHGRFGLRLGKIFKLLLLPGWLVRPLSALLNPVYPQMKRMKCDLWIFPAPDALAYQLPLPALTAIHDLMHRYEGRFPEVGGGLRYYVRDHRFGAMARWARGVLVDSEVGRQQVVDSYGVSPARIHPLPYIPPRSILERQTGVDVVAKYGLPEKFFFYPAQLWEHKNHKRLISAGAALKEKYPDIHFVFTGRGRHSHDDIHAHAAAEGMLEHVTFLDYVPADDLPDLYRRARALVMPTFLGPTNIPPLEAFACGCPVAISGIYGMPEQLGDAALYFDPTSTADMAGVLERLWRDDALCETLKTRGAKHTAAWGQTQFDARFREIINHVLENS
jgi:glycosyltransferase involved in cell wall biosynthesis